MPELLVVVGIVGMLASLFAVSLTRATSFARSAACKNNLRQQGLALAMYLNDNHAFPLAADARVGFDFVRSGQTLVTLASWAKQLKGYVQPQRTPGNASQAFLCPQRERVVPELPRVSLNSSIMAAGSDESLIHGAYGYNAYGTGISHPELDLGLGRELRPEAAAEVEPVPETRVAAPSDMVATADSSSLSPIISPQVSRLMPVETLRLLPSRRHSKGANVLFCDGHAQSLPFRKLVAAESRSREDWNSDHLPHPETW